MVLSNARLQEGFNLIELIVSVAILGLLIVVVTTSINYPRIREYASDTKRKAEVAYIANVLGYYYSEQKNYPSKQMWDTVGCADQIPEFLKKYTNEMPCDPDTNHPYYYEPTDANGLSTVNPTASYFGFRVMTRLHNLKDSAIRVAGCDPSGCGIILQNGERPNYGVATGTRVPSPGFIPKVD
jgi:prepilin-type N-terminal cleavage/methylation domain-containing protein